MSKLQYGRPLSTRLLIRGIPDYIEVQEVYKHLSSYGIIREIDVLPEYAFVEFKSQEDATDVLEMLKRQRFWGADIAAQYAPSRQDRDVLGSKNSPNSATSSRSERPKTGRYVVQVLNVGPRTCWQQLKDFARSSGGITYCHIEVNSRRRGFLEYASQKDADRAIRDLDGKTLDGYVLKLSAYQPGVCDAVTNNPTCPRSRSRSPRRTCAPTHVYPRSPSSGRTQSTSAYHYQGGNLPTTPGDHRGCYGRRHPRDSDENRSQYSYRDDPRLVEFNQDIPLTHGGKLP